MPQPDLSRDRVRLPARSGQRPVRKPEQDGRTPDDRDGNEELERQKEEKKEVPSSHSVQTDRRERELASGARRSPNIETDDTGEWVATQPFTIEDELDDTWPNVPGCYWYE